MSEIKTEIVKKRRGQIDGSGAWLSRNGPYVKISYDYAGRFSQEDQHFSVDDIAELAKFVAETDDPPTHPGDTHG